jgi:hypothetical protein
MPQIPLHSGGWLGRGQTLQCDGLGTLGRRRAEFTRRFVRAFLFLSGVQSANAPAILEFALGCYGDRPGNSRVVDDNSEAAKEAIDLWNCLLNDGVFGCSRKKNCPEGRKYL